MERSLRIPYSNFLDDHAVKQLHSTFTNRFEEAVKMRNAFGSKYGLPPLSLTSIPIRCQSSCTC